MIPLVRTVLNTDYHRGTIIPIKEHPNSGTSQIFVLEVHENSKKTSHEESRSPVFKKLSRCAEGGS